MALYCTYGAKTISSQVESEEEESSESEEEDDGELRQNALSLEEDANGPVPLCHPVRMFHSMVQRLCAPQRGIWCAEVMGPSQSLCALLSVFSIPWCARRVYGPIVRTLYGHGPRAAMSAQPNRPRLSRIHWGLGFRV